MSAAPVTVGGGIAATAVTEVSHEASIRIIPHPGDA